MIHAKLLVQPWPTFIPRSQEARGHFDFGLTAISLLGFDYLRLDAQSPIRHVSETFFDDTIPGQYKYLGCKRSRIVTNEFKLNRPASYTAVHRRRWACPQRYADGRSSQESSPRLDSSRIQYNNRFVLFHRPLAKVRAK